MKELAAERRSIAEERAQYNITMKLKQEQQQRENMKYVQVGQGHAKYVQLGQGLFTFFAQFTL